MIVGFTGTSSTLPIAQVASLAIYLNDLRVECGATALRHGDCVGADKTAHEIARHLGRYRTLIHPPLNRKYRAWCEGDELYKEKGYWARNRDIVERCELVVACPKEGTTAKDWQRSGTWYTVNYAGDHNVPVWLIFHDGIGAWL